MGGAFGTHGRDEKYLTQNYIQNHEVKRPFGRPRRGSEDVKMDFKEIICEGNSELEQANMPNP